MSSVSILDYGCGNILAFVNAFRHLDISYTVINSSQEIINSNRLICPGVGSFDRVMSSLNRLDIREALDEQVLVNGVPFLGICVGLQILGSSSSEGNLSGLGWFDFQTTKLVCDQSIVLPHMGWNSVLPQHSCDLFKGIYNRFYFLHSYAVTKIDPSFTLGVSEYGSKFSSIVSKENIFGVQFHPEKSHADGFKLLSNFSRI